MATLVVECTVSNPNRKDWIRRLLSAFNNAKWKRYEGTLDEMKGIRSGIDCLIRQLKRGGQVQV